PGGTGVGVAVCRPSGSRASTVADAEPSRVSTPNGKATAPTASSDSNTWRCRLSCLSTEGLIVVTQSYTRGPPSGFDHLARTGEAGSRIHYKDWEHGTRTG